MRAVSTGTDHEQPRRASGVRVCVFYYCRTYYKAVRVGGGGEWRTCAMRDDEPRPVWMSVPPVGGTPALQTPCEAHIRDFLDLVSISRKFTTGPNCTEMNSTPCFRYGLRKSKYFMWPNIWPWRHGRNEHKFYM
jgi:hypothetical protein